MNAQELARDIPGLLVETILALQKHFVAAGGAVTAAIERLENQILEAVSVQIRPEPVLIEFAANLVAGPHTQLILIHRHRQPIAGTEFEPAQQALPLTGFRHQKQRCFVAGVPSTQRRDEFQRVLVRELQADHDQVV